MRNRVEEAEKLFKDGYNCSQAVFAAFSDLYGVDRDMALKLSASFGGGIGRMREVCGAVSGMSMITGLETGSTKQMDDAGKKYNYEVVQNLCNEFKDINGSIICRELLGLRASSIDINAQNRDNASPQKRDAGYYKSRPCVQLVKDAAVIMDKALFEVSFQPVSDKEELAEIANLAEAIWHEHYEPILGKEQVAYMIDKFQSEAAMAEQIKSGGYQYFMLKNLGGLAGYIAIKPEEDALFLSKLYIDKKYRGRNYARKAMQFLEQYCRERQLSRIWLTVNRYNENSIKAYDKLGFVKTGTQVADIGHGYVMDDYLMEKCFES